MKFHGQYEEDRIILELLPEDVKGQYIDIGAGLPVKLSNTYFFYKMGWSGILIEPNQELAKTLQTTRSRDIILPIAITSYDGKLEMCDTIAMNSPLGGYYKNLHSDKVYEVDCITMETLLQRYPEFKEPDFVSIDIESGEDKLLSKCNFDIFKPKLIVIEHWCRGMNKEGDMLVRMDYREVWKHYLLPYYNFVEKTDGNSFYVRKEK